MIVSFLTGLEIRVIRGAGLAIVWFSTVYENAIKRKVPENAIKRKVPRWAWRKIAK